MSASFVLKPSDPFTSLELVGGKGLSLAKMIQAGFAVSNGFHIITKAYWQFIAENKLQAKIPSETASIITKAYTELNRRSKIENHRNTMSLPRRVSGRCEGAFAATDTCTHRRCGESLVFPMPEILCFAQDDILETSSI